MHPFKDIPPALEQMAFDALRFDLYRLVDPQNHGVFDYVSDLCEGEVCLQRKNELCYEIWHRNQPCVNCTSRTCIAQQSTMFKIEYLDGHVLLVVSVPVKVAGAPYALELAKDVTDSLVVADVELHDNIDITHMINRFNDLAVRDTFTKLFNKTYISNELQGLVNAERENAGDCPVALVELDIDAFKRVNDTYGHSAGDDALLYFAQILERMAEEFGAWAGRLGGDEFVLCAPNGLSDEAIQRLFAKVDALEHHFFEISSGAFSITASCGVCFLRSDDTVRSLLDRVDAAMYEAKRGPNRRSIIR